MTDDEKGFLIGQIMPDAEYSGCWYDNSIVWTDSRPMPSEEEINQKSIDMVTEAEVLANNTAAYATYNTALEAGYTHTDGVKYHCSETATLDYVKVITLFDIAPDEPVQAVTFDGTRIDMPYFDFKVMSVAVGRYQYQLRLTLWNSLM